MRWRPPALEPLRMTYSCVRYALPRRLSLLTRRAGHRGPRGWGLRRHGAFDQWAPKTTLPKLKLSERGLSSALESSRVPRSVRMKKKKGDDAVGARAGTGLGRTVRQCHRYMYVW